jgi:hypothetical protein
MAKCDICGKFKKEDDAQDRQGTKVCNDCLPAIDKYLSRRPAIVYNRIKSQRDNLTTALRQIAALDPHHDEAGMKASAIAAEALKQAKENGCHS